MNKPPLIGMEISAALLEPGQTRTFHQMECFCDAAAEVLGDPKQRCSWQRHHQIYEKALRKIRAALYRDPQLQEELKDHGFIR